MHAVVSPRAVAHRVVLRIEVLGVISFPPLALAVGFGEFAVVIFSCFGAIYIIALRWLIPVPGMIGMEGDAKRQTMFLCSLSPTVNQVFLRTDIDRVPFLILRVPKVEVVVMVT